MSDNLTARIEALEARGYVLHKNDEFAKAGEWFPWEDRLDESLTALEQAEARNAATIETLNVCQAALGSQAGQAAMQHTTGAARLNLAEKLAERWREMANDWHDKYDAERLEHEAAVQRIQELTEYADCRMIDIAELLDRAKKAEADVNAINGALIAAEAKASELGVLLSDAQYEREQAQIACDTAEAALAAERAKRCGTCACLDRHWDGTIGREPTMLCGRAGMPRIGRIPDINEFGCSNYVPNVAQQGSERDAEGTGEASK